MRDSDGKDVYAQRFRDIAMQSSDGTKLLLLTCENQDEIHPAMPIRSMLYDSLDYTTQAKTIIKKNRREKNYRNASEFLSGMTKEDRLTPIIPIIFYYGDKKWDTATDLHSLLDISTKDYHQFSQYIPNYKINLIDAKELAERNCLHTDLQQVLGMLKYKEDKTQLLNYINQNKGYFENIDADSYNAVKTFLGSDIHLRELEKKEATVNMCKALEDFYQDGINEGIEQGIGQGIEQGIKQGIKQGAATANERYSKLIIKLSEAGKAEWILEVANDSDLREKLYREYGI